MKYERLLQKFRDDPEFHKRHKARTLYLQRIRFHNPAVREKHRLACQAWRQKKTRSAALPEGMAEIKVQEVVLSFD
jgi:hypothetical protein